MAKGEYLTDKIIHFLSLTALKLYDKHCMLTFESLNKNSNVACWENNKNSFTST